MASQDDSIYKEGGRGTSPVGLTNQATAINGTEILKYLHATESDD